MTPEQLQGMYAVLYQRRDALEAEAAAIEALSLALDSYALSRGWPLAAIVDAAADSTSVLEADGAGSDAAGHEDPAPPSAIEQATSGERARGRMDETDVLPATIPASPGTAPGQGAAGAVGSPVPAFDPLTLATCPDCGHPAKNVAGLAIHRGRAHPKKPLVVDGDPTEPNGHDFKREEEVKGRRGRQAVRYAAAALPDTAEPFPDAPATSWVSEDGLLVIGDHAWSEAEWKGSDGRQWRANHSRKGRESFLCNRCSEPFPTRDALDTHLVVAHPDTETRRMPVGTRAVRSPVEAALYPGTRGGGLGE